MTIEQETIIRAGCFSGMLVVMALWEVRAPRRGRTVRRATRWCSNLGLVAVNTVLVRVVLPVTAVGAAAFAQQNQWGLLKVVEQPEWIEVLLAVVALDFVIYLQHVLFHAVPMLWRVHKVHHADLDFDTTTGVRFHTIEIGLSILLKCAAVLMLGASVLSVILFEVFLSATSLFNHGNVRVPPSLDHVLRWLVVTPDMHRVHHSVLPEETNSNFGFNLPWWDRLLGTYRDQPAQGHERMTIGLSELRDEKRTERLGWMLILPFVNPSQPDIDGHR